ncbi:Periplasmic serine endoprotease DegP [subsurface metagenome]
MIVRKDGKKIYVLTNNHVVGEADEISILMHDQRTFTGKLVGKDERKDLALVVFETKDDVPVAVLGDSDTLQVGYWAVAVGNPLGLESTVTVGIISALGRRGGPGSNISDFIQTDAAINPGNSGGALVNLQGEVIGINTWIASTTGSYIGFGFAIPINNAKKDIEDFIEHGAVQYGWLGVSIRDPLLSMRSEMRLEDINGGMAINVYKGSPADKGGIQPGDYITGINGREIKDANDLVLVVGDLPAGKSAEFDVIRYGKEVELSVKIAVREEEQKIISRSKNMWPGMLTVSSQDAATGSNVKQEPFEGVQIVIVYNDSPAAIAGLKQGDIIKEINDSKISNVLEFFKALNDKEKKEIRFKIVRQDTELSIGLFR